MAGRQQQFDFHGAEQGAKQDAEASFRYQMARLREQLAAVSLAATGLSGRRWDQVRECLMAVFSYQLAGRQPELGKLLRTSRLSRDQWYVARQHALELGLAASVRAYTGARRCADSLSIDFAGLDRLARAGPSKSDQRRASPTNAEQVRPSPTTTKEETARATEELPNNSSSSSGASGLVATQAAVIERPVKVEEVEESFGRLLASCRKQFTNCPRGLEAALRNAHGNGCTLDELWQRCKWWYEHALEWPAEHRAGACYVGLNEAQPGMRASDGWPYKS